MRNKALVIFGIFAMCVTMSATSLYIYHDHKLTKQRIAQEAQAALEIEQDIEQGMALKRKAEAAEAEWDAKIAALNKISDARAAAREANLKADSDAINEERARLQRQVQHDELIGEMRRANDIAGSAARDAKLQPATVVVRQDPASRQQSQEALDEMRRMREIEERREFQENQDRIWDSGQSVTIRHHSGQ